MNVESLRCVFGDIQVMGYWRSDNKISCVSPARDVGGAVNLTVTNDGLEFAPAGEYLFIERAVVESIHPKSGPTLGGTLVVLQGTNFVSSPEMSCKFSYIKVPATFVDQNTLHCITPPFPSGNQDETIPVSVSMNGVDFANATGAFAYHNLRETWRVAPLRGTQNTIVRFSSKTENVSGIKCVIAFANFSIDLEPGLPFGSCVIPKMPWLGYGTTTQFALERGQDLLDTFEFEYFADGAVLGARVLNDETLNTSMVHVHGSYFSRGSNTYCTIGDIRVDAEFVSSQLLKCMVPKEIPYGPTPLSLEETGETIEVLYMPPPRVKSFFPHNGPAHGKTPVVFRVENVIEVYPESGCWFAGTKVSLVRYNATAVVCVSPPMYGASRTVDLLVRINGHRFDLGFRYQAVVELERLLPSSGPLHGGTDVRIRGGVFRIYNHTILCSFEQDDRVVAVTGQLVDEQTLSCLTPRMKNFGIAQVRVSINGGVDWSEYSLSFSFVDPAFVIDVSPMQGPMLGQTRVKFRVVNRACSNESRVECRFGDLSSLQASVTDRDEIICITPARRAGGKVQVSLYIDATAVEIRIPGKAPIYTYYPEVVLKAVVPSEGAVSGHDLVKIGATNVYGDRDYTCLFNDAAVPAAVVSPNHLACYTPAWKALQTEDRNVDLTITYNGQDVATPHLSFSYFSDPLITSMSPWRGPVRGGTSVKLFIANTVPSVGLRCEFGVQAVNGTVLDVADGDVHAECSAPPRQASGEVRFRVWIASQQRASPLLDTTFTYDPPMLIRTISPRTVSQSGARGHLLTLRGGNFTNDADLYCRFGEVSSNDTVEAEYISAQEVKCYLPQRVVDLHSGRLNVVLTNNAIDFAAHFVVIAEDHRVLAHGASLGDSSAMLRVSRASGLFGHTKCWFGNVSTLGLWRTSDLVECPYPYPPSLLPESEKVRLTLSDSSMVYRGFVDVDYMYNLTDKQDPPETVIITETFPTSIHQEGGVELEVYGANFSKSSCFQCDFEGKRVTAFVESASLLRCTTPPISDKTGRILLRLIDVNEHSRASHEVDVNAVVTISSMNPSVGPVRGGTHIVFLGTNFPTNSEQILCVFGQDSSVAVSSVRPNEISCITPPMALQGAVAVRLQFANQGMYAMNNRSFDFVYVKDDETRLISPRVGLGERANVLSIRVGEFLNDLQDISCRFGEDIVVATFKEPSLLVCETPRYPVVSRTEITIDLVLGAEGIFLAELGSYVLIPPPFLESIWPEAGYNLSQTNVTFAGQEFVDSDNFVCHVGGRTFRTIVLSKTRAKCLVDEAVDEVVAGRIRMSLGLLEQEYETNALFYGLLHLPVAVRVHPSRGTLEGGTVVELQSLGWDSTQSYSCAFGDHVVNAVQRNKTALLCITPPAIKPGMVTLAVFSARRETIFQTLYEYVPPLVIERVSPQLLTRNRPARVLVYGKHFSNDTYCRVESLPCSTKVLSSTILSCDVTGESLTQSADHVLLISRGSEAASERSKILIAVRPMPVVTNVSSQYANSVEVQGEGFLNVETLSCRIGTSVSKGLYISRGKIRCTMGYLEQADRKLAVSNNGVDYAMAEGYSLVRDRPEILPLGPYSGPKDGGTLVTLLVHGPLQERQIFCRFGQAKIVGFAQRHKSGYIVGCVTPQLSDFTDGELTKRLYLSTQHENFIYAEMNFTYQAIETAYPLNLEVEPERVWPQVIAVLPDLASAYAPDEQLVLVHGTNFKNVPTLGCMFGEEKVPGVFVSEDKMYCDAPRRGPGIVRLSVTVDGSTFSPDSVQFTYLGNMVIRSISPRFGPVDGSTWVSLQGFFATNASSTLSCSFNGRVSQAVSLTNGSVMQCLSPALREDVDSVARIELVLNDIDPITTESNIDFTFVKQRRIERISPQAGPNGGGTRVSVQLSEPPPFGSEGFLWCSFGSVRVKAYAVDRQNGPPSVFEYVCFSPSSLEASKVPISVSIKEGPSVLDLTPSVQFEYRNTTGRIVSVLAHGPQSKGGTPVRILNTGEGEMWCKFGQRVVKGYRENAQAMTCRSPSSEAPGTVDLYLSANLQQFERIGTHTYDGDLSVSEIRPSSGLAQEHTPVFVSGHNFLNTSTLSCRFGAAGDVPALFISTRLILCFSPKVHPAGLLGPQESSSFEVQVTNNGINFQGNVEVRFTYENRCREGGRFCSFGKLLTTPPGTYAPAKTTSTNFTLCQPGYFQPQPGATDCMPCPVGYYCPTAGLSKPRLCPAGWVCDRLAVRHSETPCPRGRYCPEGTKSTDIVDLIDSGGNHTWKVVSGSKSTLLVFEAEHWSYKQKVLPTAGFFRESEAPNVSRVHGEVPRHCPFGHYCAGHVKDKSSAEKCMNGHFCPVGSQSREGSGSCPAAHYCPNASIAVSCPPGHMCPRVANTKPTPCLPGTFNPFMLQSTCVACPIGHICPGYGRTYPLLCPAGFVCLAEGLSAPVIQCPAGYYCEPGTSTLVLPGHTDSTAAACMPFPTSPANEPLAPQEDVDCLEFNITAIRRYLLDLLATMLSPTYKAVLVSPLRPLPCPPGTFCLGGVATNSTIDWIQEDTEGQFAPQTCQEGTFCEFASSTASGTGKCYAGHYCPPGSDFPVHAPIGTFSGKQGSIASSLCFPGTYSPLNSSLSCMECPAGFSCLGYGTYEPKICPKGTYRSLADSVTCKLCPSGTYSAQTGSPDISLCEPCPASRVCGMEQMVNLSQSVACSTGYMCGEATESSIQYLHPCPAGYYCAENTPAESGYDNACERGYFCNRNTRASLRRINECPVGYFCPDGCSVSRSVDTLCPAGTTTAVTGKDRMSGCDIDPTYLCDKDLGFDANGWHYSPEIYYPDISYVNNEGDLRVYDSSDPEQLYQVRVQRRILPVNLSASAAPWVNDTIEVLRGCPTTIPSIGGTMFTIIGRNFIDTLTLSCKITGFTSAGQSARTVIVTPAFFLSRTRVQCRFPGVDLLDTRTLSDIHVSVANRANSFAAAYAVIRLSYGLSSFGVLTSLDLDHLDQDFGHCTGDRVSMLQSNHEASDVYTLLVYDGPTRKLPQTEEEFLEAELVLQSANWQRNASLVSFETFLLRLESFKAEEEERELEKGWFKLKGVNTAYLEVNFGHIHEDLEYGIHYRLAILIANSTCTERICMTVVGSNVDEFSEREVSPCNRPLKFTTWFLSEQVKKSSTFHMSLLALEDVLFRVEVHILHGMYVPYAPYFENSVTISMRGPARANSSTHHEHSAYNRRHLNAIVSSTSEQVVEEYFFAAILDSSTFEKISPPLNMPLRYDEVGRGRVLSRFNNSAHQRVHVKDPVDSVKVGPQWWKHKGASPEEMQLYINKYRETVHDFDTASARER